MWAGRRMDPAAGEVGDQQGGWAVAARQPTIIRVLGGRLAEVFGGVVTFAARRECPAAAPAVAAAVAPLAVVRKLLGWACGGSGRFVDDGDIL